MLDKFTEKKRKNQTTAKLLDKNVSDKTSKRVNECGDWLESVANRELDKLKIHQANFCKNRFCPMCAWRAARKNAMRIGILMEYIAKEHGKEYIFLTLTAPNVKGEDLPAEITKYNDAFKKLTKREAVAKINHGYIRKLEITYNEQRNDYHTHFHCVMAVNKSYFKSRDYIKQADWLDMWRDVMGDYSITQVDVRRVKNDGKGGEASEVAKYTAKDEDYNKNQDVFDTFYGALKGRQVLTFNGLFKTANAMYKTGDLDEYKGLDTTEYWYMLMHRWGNGEYIEKSRRELTPDEKLKINLQPIDGVEVDA